MDHLHVVNTIIVPPGMEETAKKIRNEYVSYFSKQEGFIGSTFLRSIKREKDGSTKYINTVVWESYNHFEKVVNLGFKNNEGLNEDGFKVLGKGFPEPIKVSPGQYTVV
ncbi:antibiotic biosynthesis monooxygenase [Agaribacterium sp. ZY112]|uniref:antibiotic biosynthesis monooxygenase family protein n=1 Tax=Agaribacterium sp. ZY112 TaxID=3233574 RepID=UPI00352453FD